MSLRQFCYFILLMFSTGFYAQETYLDTFTSTFYGSNEGTQNFSSNWFESGDDGNAWGGRIQITGGRLRFRNLDNRYIYRFAPLAGASSATLTLDYDANSAGGEAIDVYIYNADTNQWNFVQRIDSGTGTLTYNLTNAQIDSNPAVIFYRGDTNWQTNDTIFIDNVQFTATFGSEILVDDVTVNESDGTATFTVRHSGSAASGPYSVNYTTSDISAIAGQDYTASSGTLNFDGTIFDTETITVFINDDTIFEGDELFQFSFTSTSDANVDITDTATGTILANDALIITDGGSATTCDDIFLDSGGISNYSDNEDMVYTICPDIADNYTQVNFDQFDVIPGDILYVYDGNNTSATLIGQYDNDNIPTQIFATNANGCLTFRFTSNNNTTGNGWQATVSCSPPGPKIVVEDVYVDEDSGSAIFSVTHIRDRHGFNWLFGFVETPFTVEYMVSDGTATNGSDYISVNGTLTFTGEVGNVQTFSVPIVDDGIPELVEFFTVGFSDATAQYATVDYSDTANGYINSQILANDPLTLFQEFDGYYDYSTTGGSLRTNDNNTDACSITTSSSNTLIAPIPNTGTIKKAYLYWAHSSTVVDGSVTFEGQTVNANFQYQTTLTNRNFYGYVSDVTDIVAGVADPSTNVFDFSGLSIDNSNTYCSSATVLGGWTLFVFYEDPNLPAVNINLYQGFDGLSNDGNSFTLDGFYAIAGAGAKASFLSWEGDSTLDGNSSGTTNPNGERLSITNQANDPPFVLSGDGGQTGNNAYNSTMFDNTTTPDYNVNTTYGVDLDTYDISTYISPGDSQVTANVDVGQDFLISAAVVLKVPSNLIAGTVFEDVNYGGGLGRNMTDANGVGIASAIVELYEDDGTFVRRTTSKVGGDYSFGGMADGDYYVKLVNSTVRSNRDNGINCTTCVPIQTFRSYGDVNNTIEVLTEIGGTDPTAFSDSALGVFDDSQSLSLVSIASSGVANIDFGFNFNTIVNTNSDGQGSLEQFIVNSNTLGETGLDIEANSIFDPVAGEDVSIFMIPPTSDSFGRTADANYDTNGYFDITLSNANTLSTVIGTNTIIDGRTQTAYSGDTNTGVVGSGSTGVGVTNTVLPDYDRPEIQVNSTNGDVFRLNGDNVTVSNIAVYSNINAGIQVLGGTASVTNNLIGVNALGVSSGNIDFGVEQTGGEAIITANYISSNTNAGILIDGGTRSTIQLNHLEANGNSACADNILVEDGSTINIQQNLIETAASSGIDVDNVDAVTILNNNITASGQNGGNCTINYDGMAIKLNGNGAVINQNRIFSNGSEGIVVVSGTDNLISQNSIYANGKVTPSLGIDLNRDGVTLNDNTDSDSGPNGLLNFPIISGAFMSGGNLVVEGWSRPGATIEIFLTDVSQGTATEGDNQLGLSTDYGEGQVYIGTVTEGSGADLFSMVKPYTDLDGNTDNTNKFKFSVPMSVPISVGNYITTTATLSNSTSEFSPFSMIENYTVITNRRITYRIKKN